MRGGRGGINCDKNDQENAKKEQKKLDIIRSP